MSTETNVEHSRDPSQASGTTPKGPSKSAAVCQAACPLVGRVLLSLIFVMSGVHKLTAWDETAGRMEQEGMVYVPLLLFGAVLFELGGGSSVLLGLWARVGAALLAAFLIPTTLIFHDFWTYEGAEQQMQMIQFMKNLAILGGVLVVLGFGSGRCSITGGRRAAPMNP